MKIGGKICASAAQTRRPIPDSTVDTANTEAPRRISQFDAPVMRLDRGGTDHPPTSARRHASHIHNRDLERCAEDPQ